MARALRETLTLSLALGLTSIALGQDRQQPPPQQQQQPSSLGPFANPDVQKELKLSEEQITKLRDALNKVMVKYRDDLPKLDRMPEAERQKKLMAISEDNSKAISGILDAKQWKRFKQIQWQFSGVAALQDPELQKELKLNDEQKKKLDSVFNDAEKKIQDMQRGGEQSQEKYLAVIKDMEKKANDVLTEEQQKNFKEVKGPPFQPSRPSPRPPSER